MFFELKNVNFIYVETVMTVINSSLIPARPLRLLYIPLAFSSVETKLRGFNGMGFLESFVDPVDLLFLYRENRAFWEEPNFSVFNQFVDPFKEGDWHIRWADDIQQTVDERQLQNLAVSSLTHRDLLYCEVYFNGNMLFLVQREQQQHESFHDFYGAIIRKMALIVQCEIYQAYDIFKEYCRIDPIVVIDRPTQKEAK